MPTVRSKRLRKGLSHRYTGLACRLLLGALFIWAGVEKISTPAAFREIVNAYGMLPISLVNPFAVVVPWIEVIAGLCLVLGFQARSSALLLSGLLVVFGIAIGVNLYRGVELDCGCFGPGGQSDSLGVALIRDIVLLLLGLQLLLYNRKFLSLGRPD